MFLVPLFRKRQNEQRKAEPSVPEKWALPLSIQAGKCECPELNELRRESKILLIRTWWSQKQDGRRADLKMDKLSYASPKRKSNLHLYLTSWRAKALINWKTALAGILEAPEDLGDISAACGEEKLGELGWWWGKGSPRGCPVPV